MSRPITQLRVSVDLEGIPTPVGTAYVSERRGVVSTTFDYDSTYQSSGTAYPISPDLALSTVKHHVAGLPGAFADSAPDRWGRNLIKKQVEAGARTGEGGATRTVSEIDYLLGVSDETRQGALRFARTAEGPYLGATGEVPKLIELPTLLHAADDVGAEDAGDHLTAVMTLLDAGSGSLGGARPKASVRDGETLMIAKFPHRSDEWDLMLWEKTTLDLAKRAGIRVPVRQLVDVGGRHVLLLRRFDRADGQRVGYVSAMTLLGAADGGGADYLELAEAITEHGSDVRDDLSELWRRIAFSLVVNNTDDHLRNHGFLRVSSGWHLSPVFDVNPEPDVSRGRVTSIGYVSDAEGGRTALFDAAADFRLSAAQAAEIFAEVREAARSWREVATGNGATERECDRFSDAFGRFA